MQYNAKNTPALITKYVTPSVLKYLEKDCFKFGSLASYRGTEGKGASTRFSDPTEGVKELDVPHVRTDKGIEGVGLAKPGRRVLLYNTKVSSRFDLNVFCASMGGFSSEDMRNLQMSQDEAEDKLDHFVTFETGPFIHKLWACIRQREDSYFWPPYGKVADKVRYSDIVKSFPRTSSPTSSVSFDSEEYYEDAIFRKPKKFTHENEFRVILPPLEEKFVTIAEDQSMIVSGLGLSEFIVTSGRMEIDLP